ncbi:MAG: GNAT family N-acetyltransferase [Methanomassiliicoccus sp.]|nr:GNAT family N-acetyltransferase [Methanomassiliicoccus sp.]
MRSTVVTSVEELADHEDKWEMLRRESGGTVFASYALTRTWLECFRGNTSPRVILIEKDGELAGIAPMSYHSYSSKGLPIKVLALAGEVPYRLWLPTTSIMFKPGRNDVLARIIKEMDRLDWNTLTAFHLPGTMAVRECLRIAGSTWSTRDYRPEVNIILTFPEKGDIASIFERKARENLRNRMNKLERERGSIELRKLTPGMISASVDEYARQHVERWTPKGGSLFMFSDNVRFLKEVVRRGIEGDYGFAYDLMVGGEVAAQSMGFYEGDTALPYRFGMNDAFMKYSPGWMLQYLTFSDLRDRGIRQCSLGVGDEDYKYRMGGKETPLLGIMARRGLVGAIDRIARFISTPAAGSGR